MRVKFFGKQNPPIKEELLIHLFRFLDKDTCHQAGKVNKSWKEMQEKAEEIIILDPVIQRIPMLAKIHPSKRKITKLSGGMTNDTYKVLEWVLRVPGKTADFLERPDEAYNAELAAKAGLNVSIEFAEAGGLQLSRFLDKSKPLSAKHIAKHPEFLALVASTLKKLHQDLPNSFANTINIFSRNNDLLKNLRKRKENVPSIADEIAKKMGHIQDIISKYKIKNVPCHNDPTPSNFLMSNTDKDSLKKIIFLKLIDWEYSNNNDFIWDLAYFALEARLSPAQEKIFLANYFDDITPQIRAWFDVYKALAAWWITLWAWTQIANKKANPDDYKKLAEDNCEITQRLLSNNNFEEELNLIRSETESSNGIRPF